MSDLYTDNQI